jgi:hypothetical protein
VVPSLSQEVTNSESLLVREADGELLILDVAGGRIHQLNRTASMIWRMHEDGANAEEIAEALAERSDVSYSIVRADVSVTLEELRRRGIISQSHSQG